jgi:hypothetical protein
LGLLDRGGGVQYINKPNKKSNIFLYKKNCKHHNAIIVCRGEIPEETENFGVHPIVQKRGGKVHTANLLIHLPMQKPHIMRFSHAKEGPPAGTPRAGERILKITLAGKDAKREDNEEPVQKAGVVKQLCAGREKKLGRPRGRPRGHPAGSLFASK